MQTFLPYADFKRSARCLDYRRLGKQRVEVKQIYLAILKGHGAWSNHPAVKMWKGYAYQLLEYGCEVCNEWIRRGYKDSLLTFFLTEQIDMMLHGCKRSKPRWLGNHKFHEAHKSNLLRKNPEYYSRFGWKVPDNIPYVWPV